MRKHIIPSALILFLLAGSFCNLRSQEALRMPEVLLLYEKAGIVNRLLSRTGRQLHQPWVVFADRDDGNLVLGDKFYVTEETETSLHLFRASGTNGLLLVGARDIGWHPKSNFLVHFGAGFTRQSAIHKRCVILNQQATIDRIRKCEISEAGIPLYRSPAGLKPADTLPLYLVFYVYKTENNRYLLGAEYKFDPAAPFAGQVIGWVDQERVFDLETRVFLEPRLIKGDTVLKPLWVNPQLAPVLLTQQNDGTVPPRKFRYPLTGMADQHGDRIILGVTGRYAHNTRMRQLLCETLRSNRKQVDIFFILDRTIDRNRLAYVIGQIEQEYTGLKKRFGVRFFPVPDTGPAKVSIGDSGEANYRHTRDFILGFNAAGTPGEDTGNILETLGKVLVSEQFDAKHTNILVLVNNHKVAAPDAALRQQISDKLVEKNCYLLVFDYSRDNNLLEQAGGLSIAAAKKYASGLGLQARDYGFTRTAIGYEMDHAGVLSIMEQCDSGQLAAVQMQTFLQHGYAKIIGTMEQTIEQVCRNDENPVIRDNIHEDPFTEPLREIPGMEGKVRYIRGVETASIALSSEMQGGKEVPPAWKAVVAFTRAELQFLAGALEDALSDSASPHFSRAVSCLWKDLFNRFSGETLAETDILQLTPRNITSRMLGVNYPFAPTGPVNRYPLERLMAGDPELAGWLPAHRDRLEACLAGTRKILEDDRMRFTFAEGEPGLRFAERSCGIYWFPIELLP